MKSSLFSYSRYTAMLLLAVSLSSCEKIITPDLDTAAPQLVIDASLDWKSGTSGNIQYIYIYTTNAYFDTEEAPKISGATVHVSNNSGDVFLFSEQAAGTYVCTDFVPELGKSYQLNVFLNGTVYTATDQLQSAPTDVIFTQNTEGGLFGNITEIRGYFNGIGDKNNDYYLVKILNKYEKTPAYIDMDGKYYSQGRMFFIYTNDDIEVKDTLRFSIHRISSQYSNYINRLLNSTYSSSGPFSTVPSPVRGNIVNQNDNDNNPLGAFRVTQYLQEEYIVKE
ncbi:MAG: DUF4249 family protein [Capnocytophaga sp.]|nr:DUF4249 family protein [Capnocytophaga sp.]